ncbi:uncharacterized protein K452DRAFT_165356 [Aplosporella prunicola CBS 121167]|uniref:DUF6536 domain-containing protein n=1 Tax=Aplosporella prunicola CBS 121167 TaxID=1176127 RepID=A0A6A6AY61_9PEZI|nr:uncharacterized protein K452DRAFT_165356 [Aplosporella prunicola CBS 121167]KAF2135707.1 hypothetical protein K452DRAFT_165356 [Aplosporella prunicola CBS 121167]
MDEIPLRGISHDPPSGTQPRSTKHLLDDGSGYQETSLPQTDGLFRTEPKEQSFYTKFQAWKVSHSLVGSSFSLKVGAISAVIAFLVNLGVTIAVIVFAKGIHDGRGVLFQGSCATVRSINTGAHFYINLTSSLLLGASNFSMQCLSAPTREDVDKAHAKKIWLDIGVPSYRNLRHVGRKQAFLWYCLMLTSLPLHFLFNATIFTTTSASSYDIYTVNPGLFNAISGKTVINITDLRLVDTFNGEETINTTNLGFIDIPYQNYFFPSNSVAALSNSHEANIIEVDLERFSPEACREIFGKPSITGRRFVFLQRDQAVSLKRGSFRETSQSNASLKNQDTSLFKGIFNGTFHVDAFWGIDNYHYELNATNDYFSVQSTPCLPDAPYWICGDAIRSFEDSCKDICDIKKLQHTTYWSPFGQNISACYSTRVEEYCELEMSVPFAIIIVFVTLVKCCIMLFLAFTARSIPLLTVGDAISSFLERPDPATKGVHFLQKLDLTYFPDAWSGLPKLWFPHQQRRIHTISPRRIFLLGLSLLAFVIMVVVGLILGLSNLKGPKNIQAIMDIGLGVVDVRTLITSWDISNRGASALWDNALIANLPQFVLSLMYFTYNSAITALLLASEWDKYGSERKGLRVSTIPRGYQRSTHFLQLPFRFGIPLMAMSTGLHWLASQAIFVVSIDVDRRYRVMSCGYSPLAMILTLIWAFGYLGLGLVIGYTRLQNNIPIASSCSAAISAACQYKPETSQDDTRALPLKWGVIKETDCAETECSFTS